MAELTQIEKEAAGRETYRFLCRLREQNPEAWAKVQARAAEIRERKKVASA